MANSFFAKKISSFISFVATKSESLGIKHDPFKDGNVLKNWVATKRPPI